MKNRSLTCAVLFTLIIILTGVLIGNFLIKKDAYDKDIFIDDKNQGNGVENLKKSLIRVNDYDKFIEYANRNENTFIVFGKKNCHYCELYLPVLESIVEKYNADIVYVDMKELSKEDFNKVLNTQLVIPGKCTNSGEDNLIKNGFGTPLSLFVNNGQTYDCIRGYKTIDSMVPLLDSIGYIKYS